MFRHCALKVLVPSSSGHIGVRAISSSSSLSFERCINEVRLLGRVGKDPVETEDGVFFSLATNYVKSTSTAPDGTRIRDRKVCWHNIVAFRQPNKEYIMKNVTKGCRVLIDGNLVYSRYKGGNDEWVTKCSVASHSLILMDNPQLRKEKTVLGGDAVEAALSNDEPVLDNDEPDMDNSEFKNEDPSRDTVQSS